jgi:hypothetical protein
MTERSVYIIYTSAFDCKEVTSTGKCKYIQAKIPLHRCVVAKIPRALEK